MNDEQIYGMLRESMTDVRMRRPVDEIVATGRAHRRRRRLLAGVGAAGLAVGAVLALSLPGAGSPAAPATARPGTAAPTPVRLQLAGFTAGLDRFGNIEVVLARPELIAPRDLEAALATFGVRAKVTVGEECDDPKNPGGTRHATIVQAAPGTVWDVSPRQVPPGSTLYVGLFPRAGGYALADLSITVLPDKVDPICGPRRNPR